MRIGILTDIHEAVDELRRALAALRQHGADRLVFLGDVCGMEDDLEATVRVLDEAGVVGVWGNHDFGLCAGNPTAEDRRRYSERLLAFMGRLRPRLEVEGCLLTHVEPWLDPETIEDLWFFDGPPESPERVARIFAAAPNRVIFVGHYHRWMLVTPDGMQPWSGEGPIVLEAGGRHLVSVDAVCLGKCALFDTVTNLLTPFDVGRTG